MKKALILALVVSFVLSLAGTALAFPVDFTGDFRLQGRSIDDNVVGGDPAVKASWFQLRARLNFSGAVDDSTTFYGRISTRNNFGGVSTVAGTNGAELDQYGVKIVGGDWKFNIGRQAVNLGQGTIISTGGDAAGVDNKFDGLVATTKAGKVDLTFIGGKTTPATTVAKEYYGFDATTKVDDKFTVGAAYARVKDPVLAGVNIWAINTAFNANANLAFNAEYAKSNATTDNKAYFVSGTYSWDKDSFTIQYNNVKANAVDQFNSGVGAVAYPFYGLNLADNNYTGYTYVYSHPMTKAATLSIIYIDLKVPGVAGSDKELAAGVQWKF
jgi:hypothetical protein